MEGLRGFAGVNADRLAGGQQVAGPEQAVEKVEHVADDDITLAVIGLEKRVGRFHTRLL